jgi:hypothetical protein
MKAITVWQPWAQLIVTGQKLVENRVKPHPWRSAIGKRVAIHAGLNRRGIDQAGRFGFDVLPVGSIVGFVTVVAVLSVDDIRSGKCLERYRHLADHVHTEGPWCIVLENAEVLPEPIVAKGAQGLWELHLKQDDSPLGGLFAGRV